MTTRAEARDEFRRRLLAAAYRTLARDGAAGLRMRALARDLGVTPGALYRYVRSRDELLTILVLDAYNSLAHAITQAHDQAPPADHEGRWVAIWLGAHEWAHNHRHEYALIYGTPVEGYHAPEETVAPAARLILLLARVAADHLAAVGLGAEPPSEPLPDALAQDVARIRHWLRTQDVPEAQAPDALIVQVLRSWSTLIGALSMELFGHFRHSVEDGAAFLEHAARASFADLTRAIGR